MHILGKHDDETIAQLAEVDKEAVFTALMADGHWGYSMPIGGVAAYDNKVSVTGVGVDIACGNCAMKSNMHIEKLSGGAPGAATAYLRELGYILQDRIAIGVGRANKSHWAPTDHSLFDDPTWDLIPEEYRSELKAKARVQLGSVGSGNHYVDILVDTEGWLWVGVHFGSRALGYNIANAFTHISHGGKWGDKGKKEGACLLDLDTQAGKDYFDLMHLAGDYAYAGRDWVCRAVLRMMGAAAPVDTVHNHHNFAWCETHHDRDLIVVRKGATPAFPGERGFVGGSMGDDAVILKGQDDYGDFSGTIFSQQKATLCSTVHGSGRVMSRTAASGRNRWGKKKGEPKISMTETQQWLENRSVLVFGAGLDEAPQAYRRLPDVLADQGDTIEVLQTLKPLVVLMAPNDWDESGKPSNPFLHF